MRWSLLIVLGLLFSSGTSFANTCDGNNEDTKGGDVLPWPWSTQCPFAWESISGHWVTSEKDFDMHFEFDATIVGENGEKYLRVMQEGRDGEIIASGIGVSFEGSKGVMAAMRWLDPEAQKGNGYWLHISYFTEENTNELACNGERLKTAIKMTPFGHEQDNEPPLIIEKIIEKIGN